MDGEMDGRTNQWTDGRTDSRRDAWMHLKSGKTNVSRLSSQGGRKKVPQLLKESQDQVYEEMSPSLELAQTMDNFRKRSKNETNGRDQQFFQ